MSLTPGEGPFVRDGDQSAALCVLGSGSSGNCSVLRSADGDLVLIDAGLSPKRASAALEALGHTLGDVSAVVLTHLDSDHFYSSWATAAPRRLPPGASVWVHAAHAREGRLDPLHGTGRLQTFGRDPFEPARGMAFTSRLASHDAQGVATFRISLAGPDGAGGELGYLTDLGEVTDRLVEFHAGVGVLAIESNYCPRLQARSARPDFLKRRIMGGAGHLSNQQCLGATEAIGPSEHAVFLHLSRECNHPEIVDAMHEGAHYARTIASAEVATRWVPICGRPGSARPAPRATPTTLFGPPA